MQTKLQPDQSIAHKLLVQVGAGRATASYDDGRKIYNQGDHADFVYFVQEGSIKLTVTSDNGAKCALGIAKRGQFFGEACLHDIPVRAASATAIGECRITSVTKAAILSAIQEEPKFAKVFVDYLLDHNSWVEKHTLDHLLNLEEAS
jgi:CRP/FNR family transcriptional regulator, cyclic AMP receptor protein